MSEYTGGSVSYYKVSITSPTSGGDQYTAECNDIIEALGMNYAEGNAFKALWRRAAARMGKAKKGYTDGLYDAEKVVFFGERLVAQEKGAQSVVAAQEKGSGLAAAIPQVAPDDRNWIEVGDDVFECPVANDQVVCVLANGRRGGVIAARAGCWQWDLLPEDPFRIVAYTTEPPK